MLLLSSLAAHTAAHAETLETIEPARFELGASSSGAAETASPEPSIVITSFADDRYRSEKDEATDLPVMPVTGTLTPRRWTDHVRSDRFPTIGSKIGAIKWETLGLIAFYAAINSSKLSKPMEWPHFHDEGWFGKNTANLGVDKLAHAYDSYMVTEFLHWRLHEKTDAAKGDAITAALVTSGVMLFSEMTDSIEADGGFSVQDVIMNTAGEAFSVLRNTVPGLREKLDARLLLMPNSDIYTRVGKRHYAQQRYLFALKLSGFKAFEKTPLRFVELHAGYYAANFTPQAIAKGKDPERRPFVGIGINLNELFFRQPRSTVGRVVHTTLNYLQVPYTAVHVH